MRPLHVVQFKPTQFDAPLFRRLRSLGVELNVTYQRASQPVDPELGVAPTFADDLLGYEWRLGFGSIHPRAHVMVAGWAGLWAARGMFEGRRRDRTLGIRFDTVGGDTGYTGNKARIRLLRQRSALKAATVWHPVSAASEAYAASITGAHRPSVHVPYSVDVSAFERLAPQRFEGDSQLRVLVVAKLNAREGVADVIRAMTGMPGARLIVVGAGPARGALEQQTEASGVQADFVGYVPYAELPWQFARADVFVHAAHVEPWGVSVQEAMASSLPVLATECVGSARELLPQEMPFWGFRPGDHLRLRELLEGLREPRIRHQVGLQNKAASERVSIETTADNIIALLSKPHRK